MLRQICVRSMSREVSIVNLYREALSYLESLGFKSIPILSATSSSLTMRIHFLSQAGEKVAVEYRKDDRDQVLRLVFSPLEIQFIFDIILLRFNQLARENISKILIYNT